MKEWDSEKADAAAAEAENDLNEIPDESVMPVALWWQKWYMKTGHKRLGRILSRLAGSKGAHGVGRKGGDKDE